MVAIFGLVLAPSSRAATVRSWSASTAEAFAAGTLEGTSIDERGRVRLAPGVTTLWGPEQGIVWDVVAADDRSAFVALSSPGRVLRVAEGNAEPWYSSEEEVLITALAPDGEGGVYLGIAPSGTVLHVPEPGVSETVFTTSASFIWSLDLDPDGSLWVGTGLPGRLIRRAPSGKLDVVFESEDDPVRSIDASGPAVVLGTGGRGRVVRIDDAGRPFVLFDADEAEIVAVAALEDGTVFALAASAAKQPVRKNPAAAAAANAGARVRVMAKAPPDEGNGTRDENGDEQAESKEAPRPAPDTFRSPAGGRLYRIDPDGGSRSIWETSREMPFDMARGADGRLVVATGDRGAIHVLDREGRAAHLLSIGSSHASAIARTPSGRLVLGGTNDARVALIGAGIGLEGTYYSAPVDAGTVADWGRLRWDGEVPPGAKLLVQVRAGNTDEPDGTWTEWSSLAGASGGTGVETELPAARWAQVRVDLSSRAGGSPAVHRLQLFFRARNRAPQLKELKVEPSGVVMVPGPTQSSNRLGPLVADDPVSRRIAARLKSGRSAGAVRRGYEAGARTFSWSASDPDGDRLSYSLELRREDQETWFPLVDERRVNWFSWDARSLPDGLYRVRLRANDAADNPDGGALDAEQISDAFLVDNSRPRVEGLKVEQAAAGHQLAFVASDPGGSVAAVEIAMDGGEWHPLDPLDGVADSERESYELIVDAAERDGEQARAVHVRVTDAAGNLGGDLWVIERP